MPGSFCFPPRRLWAAAILALLGTLAIPTAAWALELRVADTHPGDYPTVQALNHMGALLSERSGGRLTLKVFHSRVLGEEQETIAQVKAGALDMARVNLAPFNASVPESIVPALPFLFQSVEHMHRAMDGAVGQDILKSFEPHGFIGLAYYDSGARSFYTRSGPVPVPEALRGLRIRVQQSPLFEAMIEALGAVPVPMPYGQVQVGLSTGVIDGAENNWPSFQDAGHFRPAPVYTLTEHTMAPEILVMSRQSWDRLSPEDRRILLGAAKDSVPEMRRLWAGRENAAKTALAEAGVTVAAADKARFAQAMHGLYARFANTPRLRDLVRRIQTLR